MALNSTPASQRVFNNIIAWATNDEHVRGLGLVGSRAADEPPDELADFDIQVYSQSHTPYTQNVHWLATIAPVWLCVPDQYYHDDVLIPTRLVIFDAGIKVDFAFYPLRLVTELYRDDLQLRILLDKDDLTTHVERSTTQAKESLKPTAAIFLSAVNEFWFEAYHVAKYLKRNDLWLAKFRDWTTKEWLLKIIEWREQGKHGWDYDTLYLGKHMRSWVSEDTWTALQDAFAHFDAEDSWESLFATMALFRHLASEVAQMLDCAYPWDTDEHISKFIMSLKD